MHRYPYESGPQEYGRYGEGHQQQGRQPYESGQGYGGGGHEGWERSQYGQRYGAGAGGPMGGAGGRDPWDTHRYQQGGPSQGPWGAGQQGGGQYGGGYESQREMDQRRYGGWQGGPGPSRAGYQGQEHDYGPGQMGGYGRGETGDQRGGGYGQGNYEGPARQRGYDGAQRGYDGGDRGYQQGRSGSMGYGDGQQQRGYEGGDGYRDSGRQQNFNYGESSAGGRTQGQQSWSQGSSGGWGGGGGNEGRRRGRAPKNYSRSDDRLTEIVCDTLIDHGCDCSDVEVKVNDGVVTLTGEVDDRQEKFQFEHIAADVNGVKDVQNQLRMRQRSRENDRDMYDLGDVDHSRGSKDDNASRRSGSRSSVESKPSTAGSRS